MDTRNGEKSRPTVFLALLWCAVTVTGQVFEGGEIYEDTILRRWDSPFYIREDIFVRRNAKLTLESGVELRFSPGVMLAVNGTLEAKGTPTDRILLTMDSPAPQPPAWPHDVRLVDDRSVSDGRLQLLYQGKWRGVCANAVNWTDADTTVACRHLGFDHGNFTFFSWARNDSDFMLYHQPNCNGDEMNILNCKGNNNIKIGSRICKHQQTIHLDCYGLSPNSPAHKNWWGLEFYNASIVRVYDQQHLVQINESASVLENVDIEYAGLDPSRHPVPAIRASPTGPHLVNVSIKHCALDATNYTDIKASTIVDHTVIENNRGHGVVVETHLGRVSITNSNITENKGNGVKAKFLNGNFLVLDDDDTFCWRTPTQVGNPDVMPILITGKPPRNLPQNQCVTKFETKYNQRITLNVLEMDIEPGAVGVIEVYDGYNALFTKIVSYQIINGTLPQGITSELNTMFVKFTWDNPPNGLCPTLKECVKFTIVVDVAKASKPEFYMNNTRVISNTQHGIFAENVRNFIVVNASEVTHNMYGAGLRVYGGAGDVHVNSSRLEYNQDNGVNISYDGGWRIFNQSSFSHNIGNGINITLNETRVDNKTRYSRQQLTEVSRSNFLFNEGYGVRVGNCCIASKVVVNDSTFAQNGWDGIEVESCFRIVPANNVTNFTLANNTFDANYGHAVRVTPMINMVGIMTNNTFMNHPRHTFLIDNTDDFLKEVYYGNMKVHYEIIENNFINNGGFYVIHLRLTQGSTNQHLDFKYNRIYSNFIQGAFPTMNARNRAFGVVVLSSDNVNFIRNHLENPDSRYELTTHLLDKSSVMSAKHLWWGTRNYTKIFNRIFDQDSRYDLPRINYHPSLNTDHLYGDFFNDQVGPYEPEFLRGDFMGGRLTETVWTEENRRYTVDKDITIVAEAAHGKLHLSKGTILEVENAIGILVQGFIETHGTEEQPVIIRMKNETTYHNSSLVRLVGGAEEYEGRLEIRPEGEVEWGTVCNEDWNIISASVACQMMGYVVHPDDWGFYDATEGEPDQPIWRSSVRCTELDMDITRCIADHRFDHSCNHTDDVFLRCKPPTWAGVRFLAKAEPSKLFHTVITQAGLMDPTLIAYAPAIRIDYNTHTLEHLHIIDNVHDGVEIMKNDVFANAAIRHSVIQNNHGNGVSTRTSFFELYNCTLKGNLKSGFEYNPHYTTYEARQLRTGIHEPKYLEDHSTYVLGNEAREFFQTKVQAVSGTRQYSIEIRVENQHYVVMDIIDYNPDLSRENVTVYDSRRAGIIEGRTRNWMIEADLPDFPVQSQGQYITIIYDVATLTSGRFAFVVRSKPNNWRWPFGQLFVKNCTTEENEHGIVTRHYNQPSNEYLDLFFRYRWEVIEMYGVTFENNILEALHVPSITKYHELYLPTFEELQYPEKIAEITYGIDSCLIKGNGGGVIGEHNHVEFSNNVWIWEVTNNRFENNKDGGFDIELPKVNMMYSEVFNHSVDINDTIFENNQNFEFRIDGFYCNSSISRNRFQGNICKVGCITISGTEKDFEMYENEIVENEGKYIFEINMNSHTPYTRWVDATIMYNNFRRNRKPAGSPPEATSTPTTYTMAIRGVQNITVNRNLFDNYLDFELLGGYASSSLENYLDATRNWWGTTNQEEIQMKIFDIDDWNNFAIAEYYPFLTGSYFDAPESTEGKYFPDFDPAKPLGGRIYGSVRLENNDRPYIVNRDLTIMPTGSLIIKQGVELEFYPNIGILVLGSLSVLGEENIKVKFRPIVKSSQKTTTGDKVRNRRRVSSGGPLHNHNNANGENDAALLVRLSGGDTPDEGFIEIYNETERRWALMCDSNFNEKTAEVACKTMGRESSNAIVRRSTLYDHYVFGYPKMHEQLIEWFWRETFICDGTEESLQKCRYKNNYNLYTCMEAREYVFMRCGPRNLAEEYEYWGNIRFSAPDFEDSNINPGFSVLEQVDIYGAGILHGEKVAAVQAIHRSPSTEYARITHCNHNAYDFIAPRGEFEILENDIQMNNGYAFGGLILNGDSNYENMQSSFMPLIKSTIPYDVFGLVRMCTSEKLLHVRNRLLLYYKYDFETTDCIKIMRSKEPRKRIGFRLLQFNMYNDTFYENALELYNGEFFSSDMMIQKLDSGSDLVALRKPYQTSTYYDTMGIRITASAAYGDFGFIAEVVTLPYSSGGSPDLGAGLKQRIADSVITDNEGGGFAFSNVGEDNPAFIIEGNRLQRNGLKMLNLTSPHMVDVFVQNSRLATVSNNYMVGNAGGVQVNSTTTSESDAIYFNITNNVITHNTHGESLHVEGHHFNGFEVQNNYIAFNDVGHRSVVSMFGVRLNFTTNIIFNNTGQCILNASVFEQIDINQNYIRNAFYDNQAYAANYSTVFLKSAKFYFRDNFFLNPLNKLEMVTYNRTKYPDGTYPEVRAQSNWWGSGLPTFVAGRVWDRKDDDNLIGVSFQPAYTSNQSVVEGRCYPGWRILPENNKCYLYFGGVVPFREAELECKANRARVAWARDRHYERRFGELVSSAQVNYNEFWRTWVYSEWQKEGKCTVLVNYEVRHIDCSENLPFLCERDPYINPEIYWWPIQVALGCTGATLFIVVILAIFSYLKSRQRKHERLSRRTDLKKSVHGSKASIYTSRGARSLAAAMDDSYSRASTGKRHRPPPLGGATSTGFIDLSGVTLDDSEDVLQPYKRPATPGSVLDYSSNKNDQSSYFDSDLPGPAPSQLDYYRPPRLENEIPSVRAPRGQQYYRNDAYDDDMVSVASTRAKSVSSLLGPPPQHRQRRYDDHPRAYSPGPRNPSLATSEGNLLARNIREKPPRPKPKETAM